MSGPTISLKDFDRVLRDLFPPGTSGWPFVCSGSPLECRLFVVGINPATATDFWPCWNTKTGFDRQKWLDAYLAVQPFKRTRKMLERLHCATDPVQLLETNIFHHASKSLPDLPEESRGTGVFEYLLTTIRPHVLFVHGGEAIEYFEKRTGFNRRRNGFTSVQLGDLEVEIRSGNHLSYQWSYPQVDQLGLELRDRVESQCAREG